MAEKIVPGSDPGKLMAGSGGGSLPKGGGGNFSLPRETGKPMFTIWQKADSFGPAKQVSEARTLKGAFKAIDRWDTKYGSAVHYKKRID